VTFKTAFIILSKLEEQSNYIIFLKLSKCQEENFVFVIYAAPPCRADPGCGNNRSDATKQVSHNMYESNLRHTHTT
jgi:hypothetical protein